jgi:hypothetical protein
MQPACYPELVTLFWGMLLGATLPAIIVWAFGRHLRRISGQPGLVDYVRLQQRRAKRHQTRDPVLGLLLDDDGRPLDDEQRRALEQHFDRGSTYRPTR